MKALRFDGERLVIADVPKPAADGEALVRVTLSGICSTDLEIIRGYAGFVGTLGHEFVGVVEQCPERGDLVGRRVVGEINAGCGVCDRCKIGDPRHCSRRTVLGIVGRDGCHAEYLCLPAANLVPVPESVDDRTAVFTEPLSAAIGILERVPIEQNTRAAVIGDGKLGLLSAFALSLKSGDLILVGKHENKLDLARRRGITSVMPAEAGELSKQFDVVVEASGSASGLATAMEMVRPRGTIVLKSTFQGATQMAASRIVVDEISIVGSRCGRFAPALDLLAQGVVRVDDGIPRVQASTKD